VWLTIELVAALYVISFVWFWSLCRLSIPDKAKSAPMERESNLIPFERGSMLKIQKTSAPGISSSFKAL
jgi:hypothetical protein